MVRPITPWLTARSWVEANAANTPFTEQLDYQLAVMQGIEIARVSGYMRMRPAVVPLTPETANDDPPGAVSTLHIGSPDELQDIPTDVDDASTFQTVTDEIARQHSVLDIVNNTTTDVAYAAMMVDGVNWDVTFEVPVLTVRPLTHRLKTGSNTFAAHAWKLTYRYVQLTTEELGRLLARRI